jgi:hypothetical protein
MKSDWRLFAATAAIGFLLSLALFGHTAKERERVSERVVIRTRFDTIREIVRVPLHPIEISAKATRIIRSKRKAELDTLLRIDSHAMYADTVRMAYTIDSNLFDLDLRLSPRMLPIAVPITLHDTVTERDDRVTTDDRPWYEEALMILGAAAAGYLLGKVP